MSRTPSSAVIRKGVPHKHAPGYATNDSKSQKRLDNSLRFTCPEAYCAFHADRQTSLTRHIQTAHQAWRNQKRLHPCHGCGHIMCTWKLWNRHRCVTTLSWKAPVPQHLDLDTVTANIYQQRVLPFSQNQPGAAALPQPVPAIAAPALPQQAPQTAPAFQPLPINAFLNQFAVAPSYPAVPQPALGAPSGMQQAPLAAATRQPLLGASFPNSFSTVPAAQATAHPLPGSTRSMHQRPLLGAPFQYAPVAQHSNNFQTTTYLQATTRIAIGMTSDIASTGTELQDSITNGGYASSALVNNSHDGLMQSLRNGTGSTGYGSMTDVGANGEETYGDTPLGEGWYGEDPGAEEFHGGQLGGEDDGEDPNGEELGTGFESQMASTYASFFGQTPHSLPSLDSSTPYGSRPSTSASNGGTEYGGDASLYPQPAYQYPHSTYSNSYLQPGSSDLPKGALYYQ
ncbi:hypothetical protein LTR85_004430 [Meristemomyces frigidus]|nr:hypothetical protein LTR85_004430 [Meristemomyces frigidus]